MQAWLVMTLILSAAPAPGHGEVVVEAERHGVMMPEARVFEDGRWERGDGTSGRLDDAARRALARLVSRLGEVRALGPLPQSRTAGCPAGLTRLSAGGKTWSWVEGCGEYPSLGVERVLHFLRRQTYARHADPAVTVVLVLRGGALLDPARGGPSDELIVKSDGSWIVRRGGVETRGRLGDRALTRLITLAARARPDFDATQGQCRARPTGWHHLQVPGVADALWYTPCGLRPGAAVEELVREARAAVEATRGGVAPERPEAPMLTFGRGDFHDAGKQGPLPAQTRIMADGTWTKPDGTRGRLGSSELEALRDAIARTRFEMAPVLPGTAMCAAVPSASFELATGDGRWVRWTGPCAPPPDPSVLALTRLLAELTGG